MRFVGISSTPPNEDSTVPIIPGKASLFFNIYFKAGLPSSSTEMLVVIKSIFVFRTKTSSDCSTNCDTGMINCCQWANCATCLKSSFNGRSNYEF